MKQPNKKCDCGAPLLNESLQHKMPISEAMRYHLDNNIQIHDNIFRPGSKSHIELLNETRLLWVKGIIELIKSLFKKGSVIEKVKTVKELDKEIKKIVPADKKHVKKKEK